MKKTKKTEITHAEFLQMTGLLSLADKHGKVMTDIVEALREITGEEDSWGHCGDAVYSMEVYSPQELLRRLELTVAARPSSPKDGQR